MTTVCRVCLTGGSVRMKTIQNNYRQLYEQLARVTVNTDEQLMSMCYICHSQLMRCRSFSDMAHRSETILTDLRNRRIEATHENIIALNLLIPTSLAVSQNHHTIYINASKENGEKELVFHKETFSDEKEDVVNIDTISKENITSTGLDLNSETEYKSIKIEDIPDYDNDMDYSNQEQFNNYTCNICFSTFQLKNSLDKHMKIHSGEEKYASDKKFSKESNYTVHNKTRTKQNTYVCKLCNKTFPHKSNLTAHSKYHDTENPMNCNHCNKTYKDITNFNKHMNKHKQSRKNLFSCNECDKKFTDKGHLSEHSRVHSGERPYACSICPKRFYKKGHLNEHKILHSGEKPHGCSYCGKKFAHKSNLTVHLRLHDKEQTVFDCSRCEKKFTQRGSLRRHLKTHGDDLGLLRILLQLKFAGKSSVQSTNKSLVLCLNFLRVNFILN